MENLVPEELIKSIPGLYDTEEQNDPICHVKLFLPDGNFTWYIIEICKEEKELCFGYVKTLDSELGYFSLKEIESITGSLGLRVERDLGFKPTKLSVVKREI